VISIVICTYNRADHLRETLAHVRDLDTTGLTVEAIVIDNNSTDATAAVISEAAAASPFEFRHETEPRQGKSFALNRALEMARGDILAMTDDDVWPRRDWLLRIAAAFDANPIVFTGGKVLPRWERPPRQPLEEALAPGAWGPLALVDYGDEAVTYNPDGTGLAWPIGANVAIRRDAVVSVGGWRTDLGKVNNSLIAGEDHELLWRLRMHGLFAGWYDPLNVVEHFVPASRMRYGYFWRWFYWNGRTEARRAEEWFKDLDLSRVPLVMGAPRFLYRKLLEQAGHWLSIRRRGFRQAAFVEEMRTVFWLGFISQCWSWRLQSAPESDEEAPPEWQQRRRPDKRAGLTSSRRSPR
jgi:glycosyltransferase involved in cell wall biosynthesis